MSSLLPLAGLMLVALAGNGAGDTPLPPASAVLRAAQAHLGAPLPRGLRVIYLGTGDATAVYQGQGWQQPEPQRHQATLILDFVEHKAALRTEQTRRDGTVSLFRNRVTPDGGSSVNLISGLAFPMSPESARQAWTGVAWLVPHHALAELAARPQGLRVTGVRRVGERDLVVTEFTPQDSPAFSVLFDTGSGALAGYEYTQPYLFGPTLNRLLFKPYREVPGVGRFPAGYVQSVGDRTYRDLDVFDVRSTPEVTAHGWLAKPPEQKREASTSRPAATTLDLIAPGVHLLRRIGAYNALVVEVDDCLALIDAPASFASATPIPVAPPPGDLGERIVGLMQKELGRKVCYVVPTHHHADHSGAVAALARAGAQVLTAPPDVELMRRLGGPGADVQPVAGSRKLGPVELHRVTGGSHVSEMLFAYIPAIKAVFEGDNADYMLQSRQLQRYFDSHSLAVDTIYSVHSSGTFTPAEMADEEPSN